MKRIFIELVRERLESFKTGFEQAIRNSHEQHRSTRVIEINLLSANMARPMP